MSTTFGEIVDTTLRSLRRSNDEDDRKTVSKFVNKFYFDICRSVPIKELRRRVEVDLGDGDYDDGVWLKSNMADILRVSDVDDEFEYIHRDRASVESDEVAYRYYDYIPDDGARYVGTDGFVKKGAGVFTPDPDADYSGEYIKFGSEPGFYLLTATAAFSPKYYGENIDGKDFVIRPAETRKIVCIDKDNDEITDKELYVDYWIYPPALYRATDMPLLPSTRALELMVMKEAMVIIGKRQLSANTFDRDINTAMAELRKLNPPPSPVLKARDTTNAAFTMAGNIFTDRDD